MTQVIWWVMFSSLFHWTVQQLRLRLERPVRQLAKASHTTMNDLPQELVDGICSYLPREDLQNVLMLSRQFQYSAEKYSGFFEKYTLDTDNSAEFHSRFSSYRLMYLQEAIFRPTFPPDSVALPCPQVYRRSGRRNGHRRQISTLDIQPYQRNWITESSFLAIFCQPLACAPPRSWVSPHYSCTVFWNLQQQQQHESPFLLLLWWTKICSTLVQTGLRCSYRSCDTFPEPRVVGYPEWRIWVVRDTIWSFERSHQAFWERLGRAPAWCKKRFCSCCLVPP